MVADVSDSHEALVPDRQTDSQTSDRHTVANVSWQEQGTHTPVTHHVTKRFL